MILMRNFDVLVSQDVSSDEESDELLDVKTEFNFSSLESLSSLSSRLTMRSDEINDNPEEEEEEEFNHLKGMLDESRRWPKDLEGLVIIPYDFFGKSKYSKF